MKFGIVSDIHANLAALETVVEHMDAVGVDKKVCLGDLVGYAAQPNECIQFVSDNFNYIIKGNHDEDVTDLEKLIGYTPLAKQSLEWTHKELTGDSKEFLAGLEYGFYTDEGYAFVHGSPSNAFNYIFEVRDAADAFNNSLIDFTVCFVGHTHLPITWVKQDNAVRFIKPDFSQGNQIESFEIKLDSNNRHIVNVGSTGQPRDNNPRACYVVFDTVENSITYYRIPYRVDLTVSKMQQARFSFEAWQRIMTGV